jgi:hypothetical protein
MPPGGYQDPYGAGPPPKGKGGTIAILVIVGLLVLGGAGVATYLLISNSDKNTPVAGPTASSSESSAPPTTRPSRSTATRLPTTARPSVAPVTPGGQAVVAVAHEVAYDVPGTDWKVESPDLKVSVTEPQAKDQAKSSGVATYRKGYCAGESASFLAQAGVVGWSTTAPDETKLAGIVEHLAYANYGTPDEKRHAQLGTPVPTRPAVGGQPAIQVMNTVTLTKTHDCDPPSALLGAVAFQTAGGKYKVLVFVADQGVPNALTGADFDKIVPTIRPMG